MYKSAPDQRIYQTSRNLPALTGLRAIAASLVFFHHHNPASANTFAYRLIDQGYTGVTLFFVLSGFLIYHRYADSYFSGKNWSWHSYLWNRFARIFPLYSLVLLLTIGVYRLKEHLISWQLIALNFSLLKGFFDTYKFTGIAQSWSLTVELCFYLSAPLLFIALKRLGPSWLTLSLVSIGLILWQTLGKWTFLSAPASGLFGSLPFVMFYTFFGRGFEFIVGMWLAQRWHQNRLPQIRYALFWSVFIIACCMLWQAFLPTCTKQADSVFWSEVLVYNYFLPIGVSLFFTGLLIQPSVVQKLLSHPFIQLLGRSSYAFFLIHNGVIANSLQKFGITNVWLLFLLLIGISCGLYRFVEKPLARLLKSESVNE
ncbi:acyltransferase family protein [Spirosoma gilvum]